MAQIKKGAEFLRLPQVCIRKRIPQLSFIVYTNFENMSIYHNMFFAKEIFARQSGRITAVATFLSTPVT